MITLKVVNIPAALSAGFWFATWTPVSTGNPYNLLSDFTPFTTSQSSVAVPSNLLGQGTIGFFAYDASGVAQLAYTTTDDIVLADGQTITWDVTAKKVNVTGGDTPPPPPPPSSGGGINWMIVGSLVVALVAVMMFRGKK